MMKRLLWLPLFVILLASLGNSSAAAQQPTPSDDEVNVIAKQLFCPVCENTPLDVCPTQACAQWRELIREKLAEGWSEERIKNYFVEQYGARVLGAPPARGLNWLVYVIPPVAIIAGVYILYRAMRSWKQSAQPEAPEKNPEVPQDEYLARLEEELRKR